MFWDRGDVLLDAIASYFGEIFCFLSRYPLAIAGDGSGLCGGRAAAIDGRSSLSKNRGKVVCR